MSRSRPCLIAGLVVAGAARGRAREVRRYGLGAGRRWAGRRWTLDTLGAACRPWLPRHATPCKLAVVWRTVNAAAWFTRLYRWGTRPHSSTTQRNRPDPAGPWLPACTRGRCVAPGPPSPSTLNAPPHLTSPRPAPAPRGTALPRLGWGAGVGGCSSDGNWWGVGAPPPAARSARRPSHPAIPSFGAARLAALTAHRCSPGQRVASTRTRAVDPQAATAGRCAVRWCCATLVIFTAARLRRLDSPEIAGRREKWPTAPRRAVPSLGSSL